MERLYISFSLLFLTTCLSAQVKEVTAWKGSNIVSYSILRYSPSWQVQTGEVSVKASSSQPFIRDVKQNEVEPLMGLLYGSANKKYGSAKEFSNAFSKSKVELYSQIKHGKHHIFIACLDGSQKRSIIPFIEEGGKWILDVDFSATPLYEILRDERYNPMTGKFSGVLAASLGFEGLDGNALVDHSGYRQRTKVKNIAFADGYLGKALRLNPSSQVDIEVKKPELANGADFSMSFWLKIGAKEMGKIISSSDASGVRSLEIAKSAADKISLQLADKTGKVHQEVTIPTDKWVEVEIKLNRGDFVVSVDNYRSASTRTTIQLDSPVQNLTIGGSGAAIGLLDELNVSF